MNAADDDADEEELRRRKRSSGSSREEELLAEKLALLTDEQRLYYQNTVDFATERQVGEAGVTFRLDLAKIYLQGLPPGDEANRIGQHIQDERDRVGEDLLAKRLALLTGEQRQNYQTHVDNAIEANSCETSVEFKLGIAGAYLRGLPLREEAREINNYIESERNRAYWENGRAHRNMIRAKLEGIDPTARDHHAPNQPAQNQPSPERANPTQGARPSAPHRDYGELKKTHEQVAQLLSAKAHNPTPPLSKEELKDISKRFADMRKTHNLKRSAAELRELKDLAQAQKKSREKLNRAHGPKPGPQQKQERELLDRQHLAERVGVKGRWLGQDLRRTKLPGAERCEQEARRAHHAGRQLHEQRQNLKANPMPRMRPSAAQRDEQAAQRSSAEAHISTPPLSKEQLKDISKRFADMGEAHNLKRSSAELNELKDLAQAQKKSREKLDRAHGPKPGPQQKQERELLDRQHLAERVGVKGRWLGQDLRRKKLPGAERCEQEARRAHHAGRQFHEQRQNLKADPMPGMRPSAAHTSPPPLSKEQLKVIAKRFADMRETHNLKRSSAELSELKDLAQTQKRSRDKLDRAHGPKPGPQQKQERELLERCREAGIDCRVLKPAAKDLNADLQAGPAHAVKARMIEQFAPDDRSRFRP